MSRKRIPWDGPDPHPGDYVEARLGAGMWLLRDVTPLRRPDVSGARLTIEVAIVALSDVPRGAVVHPRTRMATADPEGPPRVRQIMGGVVRASWRDPDDIRPSASRRPREIDGFRAFCPLRRIAAAGGPITDRHIAAADHIRGLYDLARLGWASVRDLRMYQRLPPGPSSGPTAGQVSQARAAHDLNRCLKSLVPLERDLVERVVLGNEAVAVWCIRFPWLTPHTARTTLIVVLDRVADHYAFEVDQALAADSVVAA